MAPLQWTNPSNVTISGNGNNTLTSTGGAYWEGKFFLLAPYLQLLLTADQNDHGICFSRSEIYTSTSVIWGPQGEKQAT
jgi:hypothetical protein